MRPHKIQVSSSRCDRLEEAEELDTSEEPLFRREPLIDRIDLESASSNLMEDSGLCYNEASRIITSRRDIVKDRRRKH